MLFTYNVYTVTFILNDLKAYCLLLFPLKSSFQVSYQSRIRNSYIKIYIWGGYSRKICWDQSSSIPPVPQKQLGGAPPNQPPPTKNLQRTPCGTLPKELAKGANLTYESIISPSLQ